MLSFKLKSLKPKELFKDVIVKIVNGNELMVNFFELKNETVKVPFHKHPVEHLVIVLEGELEFILNRRKIFLESGDGLFLPAGSGHSARVIVAPVRAFEVCKIAKDTYYERKHASTENRLNNNTRGRLK